MTQCIYPHRAYLKNRLLSEQRGGKKTNQAYRTKRFLRGITDHNRQLEDEGDAKTKARIEAILKEFPWKEDA